MVGGWHRGISIRALCGCGDDRRSRAVVQAHPHIDNEAGVRAFGVQTGFQTSDDLFSGDCGVDHLWEDRLKAVALAKIIAPAVLRGDAGENRFHSVHHGESIAESARRAALQPRRIHHIREKKSLRLRRLLHRQLFYRRRYRESRWRAVSGPHSASGRGNRRQWKGAERTFDSSEGM
jgi:hypothetical protein